ncbi:MAG: SDR family NAD(P)-dependent oxidoreductase [Burkholderiales bacterium]|nr:SDR family NAD(P)-dependent oxidoreductase [Burkholderiales bacterium]
MSMSLNPRILDWRGRRVWLIGASTGIGAAFARLLLEHGARVALSARTEAALLGVAGGHAQALVLPADATREDELRAVAARIDAAWGGIDLVVYLAGTYAPLRAWDIDLGQIKRTFDINVIGCYGALAAVLPGMLARGNGAVAIVSSVAGYRGLPNALAYGPAKAALINLAEALYLDLAPKGIAVHLIDPGFVDTPLTAQNEFSMPGLISAAAAARAMLRGLERGEFETHFPKRFTLWMRLLRLLPYRLYFPVVRRFTGL